jgi:hypothetical protein
LEEKMKDIEMEPRYSTVELPGRCLKCLAEQEYGDCLRALLRGDEGKKELEEKFEAVLSLLKSPDLIKLRSDSEKYLSDGKKVRLVISHDEGNPEYRLEVEE